MYMSSCVSSEGQEGVTIVDTGDSLCDVDLLLMMMLLPAVGELFKFFLLVSSSKCL